MHNFIGGGDLPSVFFCQSGAGFVRDKLSQKLVHAVIWQSAEQYILTLSGFQMMQFGTGKKRSINYYYTIESHKDLDTALLHHMHE